MSEQVFRVWTQLREARYGTRSHFSVRPPDRGTRHLKRSDSEVVMEDLAITIADLNQATRQVISRFADQASD